MATASLGRSDQLSSTNVSSLVAALVPAVTQALRVSTNGDTVSGVVGADDLASVRASPSTYVRSVLNTLNFANGAVAAKCATRAQLDVARDQLRGIAGLLGVNESAPGWHLSLFAATWLGTLTTFAAPARPKSAPREQGESQ